MAGGFTQQATGAALTGIVADVAALGTGDVRLASGAEQLALLRAGLRVEARLHTWLAELAAHVDAAGVAWQEHGASTPTWLADAANLTRREAARLIAAGQGLARFGVVAAAAESGAVLPAQAEAITGVLDALPEDFGADVVARGQELMVGFAATHNSTELRRLSRYLLETLAPETVDEREAARLEREHRLALRNRYLTFTPDHQGSVLLRGSLPVADAEAFIAIVDAYAAVRKRGIDRLDPHAEYLTPAMNRADALMAMVRTHARGSLAPNHGGDRPRIVVTMSYDKLAKAAVDGGLLRGQLVGSAQPVPAGLLRQWLCDADLMPAVLGGESELLDVGRTQRLVTAPIRAALELRDGGCIFPGCDKPPNACQAHHRKPWWAGGETSLTNLVLVCDHHHGIVEPGRDPTADRWRVEFRADGVPQVIPPKRVDPSQRPRVHARFSTPMRR